MVDAYLMAFVKRAKNRLQILKLLGGKEKTQAELHKESGLYRTHVRRTLLELEGKGLVKCLNPKDRLYKMYRITPKGKSIVDKTEN